MEKILKPDRKLLIKGSCIFLTITVAAALVYGLINLILLLAGPDPEASMILGIVMGSLILAMWIIGYPLLYLWIRNLEYVIHDDRVAVHKGILTKTKQNIPFRAITDFALVRTLYDRFLGIGSIKIQTAGQHMSSGSRYEGSLPGLIDFENLHAELRDKIKSLHPSSGPLATSDTEVKPEGDLLHEILKELQQVNRNLAGKQNNT